MPTDSQSIATLNKRANRRANTTDARALENETLQSAPIAYSSDVWMDADLIPIAGSNLAQVMALGTNNTYTDNTRAVAVVQRRYELTTAVNGSAVAFYSSALVDCIPANHTANYDYKPKLYINTGSGPGAEIPYGRGDWVIDSAAGLLRFYASNITSIAGTRAPYVSFWKYIGRKVGPLLLATKVTADAALPRTGGTMTGALNMGGNLFSGAGDLECSSIMVGASGSGIDSSGVITCQGLIVYGESLVIETTTLTVGDNTIVVNSTPGVSRDAGFLVQRYIDDIIQDAPLLTRTVTAATSTTVSIAAPASLSNNTYNEMYIKHTHAGGFQTRTVSAYTASTRTLSVDPPFSPTPVNDDTIEIFDRKYVGLTWNTAAREAIYAFYSKDSAVALTPTGYVDLRINSARIVNRAQYDEAIIIDTQLGNTGIYIGANTNPNASAIDTILIGTGAGESLDTASYNVGLGAFTLSNMAAPSAYNTAIGHSALAFALNANAQRNRVTAIGAFAGSALTIADYDVVIGAGSTLANQLIHASAGATRHWSPAVNGVIDLGTNNRRWKAAYVADTLYIPRIVFDGNIVIAIVSGESQSIYLGHQAGAALGTLPGDNILIGNLSGSILSGVSSYSNIAIGAYSLYNAANASCYNVAIGHQVLLSNLPVNYNNVIALGAFAGTSLTISSHDVIIGNGPDLESQLIHASAIDHHWSPATHNTIDFGLVNRRWKDAYISNSLYTPLITFDDRIILSSAYDDRAILIGSYAGLNLLGTETNNILVGPYSGLNLQGLEARCNVVVGAGALRNSQLSGFNVAIGFRALAILIGPNRDYNNVIAIGPYAGADIPPDSHDVIIGGGASINYQLIRGSTAIGARHWSPAVNNAIDLGIESRAWRTLYTTNISSTLVTFPSEITITSALSSCPIKIGYTAGNTLTDEGGDNIVIGTGAGYSLPDTAINNVAIGALALTNLASTSSYNTAIGYSALAFSIESTRSRITAIGAYAGSALTIADYDVVIGAGSTLANQLIHASAGATRHWSPAVNGVVDLGIADRRWKSAYVDDTLYIPRIAFDANIVIASGGATQSIYFGYNAGAGMGTIDGDNILIGNASGGTLSSVFSVANIGLGASTLHNASNESNFNIAIGHYALWALNPVNFTNVIALGAYAGYDLTVASYDVIIGSSDNIDFQLIHGSTVSNARHWSPAVHNAIDLGLTGRRWKDAYIGGTHYITGGLTLSFLTSTRVPFISTGGAVSNSSEFTWVNSTLYATNANHSGYMMVGSNLAATSIAHVYENSTATGTSAGLTIQQAGSGDALLQLLAGSQRWVIGADTSDSAQFKIASASLGSGSDRIIISTTGLVRTPIGIAIGGGSQTIVPSATAGTLLSLSATTLNNATTAASGTSPIIHGTYLAAPTLTSTNASVTTPEAYTMYIAGAPIASTNTTITTPYALYVGARSAFAGTISVTSSVSSIALIGTKTASTTIGATSDALASITEITTFTPNATTANIAASYWAMPTFAVATSRTLGIAAGMYSNLQYSGNTGTITIAAGVYVAAGSSDPTGTTVNAYGIYVKRPIAGDTNTALYADDITSNNDITIATGSLAINTTVLAAGYFPYQATNKLARSALFQGAGPTIAVGGTNLDAIFTIQDNETALFAANTAPVTADRLLMVENTNATNAALQYAAIALQINPAGSLTGGRVLGDLRLIRETLSNSNSYFLFSAYRNAGTYNDFMKIGFDTSYLASSLYIGGATTPTAKLHLAAGSATASSAPIKFTSGTLNTTAEAGAVEYNGSLFFASPANSSRFPIAMGPATATTANTIAVWTGTNASNIRGSSITIDSNNILRTTAAIIVTQSTFDSTSYQSPLIQSTTTSAGGIALNSAALISSTFNTRVAIQGIATAGAITTRTWRNMIEWGCAAPASSDGFLTNMRFYTHSNVDSDDTMTERLRITSSESALTSATNATIIATGTLGVSAGIAIGTGTQLIIPSATSGALLSINATTLSNATTAASGTSANAIGAYLAAPTLASVNASVTTPAAYTMFIAGAPIAGTNTTITAPYALYVGADSVFAGSLIISASSDSIELIGTKTAGITINVNTTAFGSIVDTTTFAPTTTPASIAASYWAIPTFATVTSRTLQIAAGIYTSPLYTGNAGTITVSAGIYIAAGGASAGTITTAYGLYAANPTAGTTKIAAYMANASVGYDTTAPPTNGLIVSGIVGIATNSITSGYGCDIRTTAIIGSGSSAPADFDLLTLNGTRGWVFFSKWGGSGATSGLALRPLLDQKTFSVTSFDKTITALSIYSDSANSAVYIPQASLGVGISTNSLRNTFTVGGSILRDTTARYVEIQGITWNVSGAVALSNTNFYFTRIGQSTLTCEAQLNGGSVNTASLYIASAPLCGATLTMNNSYGLFIDSATTIVATNAYSAYFKAPLATSTNSTALYADNIAIGNTAAGNLGTGVVSISSTAAQTMIIAGTKANSALTINGGANSVAGIIDQGVYARTTGTSAIAAGYYCLPTFAPTSTGVITIAAGMYVNNLYTGKTNTITTGAGIYIDVGGANGSGTFTTAYGLYVRAPIAGTTNVALFADNISIGVAAPTARLHVMAGSATATTAPIKFTAGTLNSAAEVGAMEYNNSLYFTPSTGIRYPIVMGGTTSNTNAISRFADMFGTRLTSTHIYIDASNRMSFGQIGVPAVIASSVVAGLNISSIGGGTPTIWNGSSASFAHYSADENGPSIAFGKSRSAGMSSMTTAVINDDILGSLLFAGANTVNATSVAAAIRVRAAGTFAVGVFSSKITFSTSTAGTLTECIVIDSSGNLTPITDSVGTLGSTSSHWGGVYSDYVSAGVTSVAASAVAQFDSTTKGILIPRMTTAQKNAIVSPATGLAVYDTTLSTINTYNGSVWSTGSGRIVGTVTPAFTFRTPASVESWSAIGWSPTLRLFAAVAGNNVSGFGVMTSSDGITWTRRATPVNKFWQAITWMTATGRFVSVAYDSANTNTIIWSANGTSWSTATSPSLTAWEDVCASTSRYVAVGSAGDAAKRIAYSDSGNTGWTAVTFGGNWLGVCWASTLNLFVTVGAGNASNQDAATSSDGVNWTLRTTITGSFSWRSVAFSPELGLFCAVSAVSNAVMTSTNGSSWSSVTTGITGAWNDIKWVSEAGAFFVTSPTSMMTSSLGTSGWSAITLPSSSNSYSVSAWSPQLRMLATVSTSTGTNSVLTGVLSVLESATAIGQFDDSSKGFIVPRLSTTQRIAISNPAVGLTVYDTSLNANCTYNGMEWIAPLSSAITASIAPRVCTFTSIGHLGAVSANNLARILISPVGGTLAMTGLKYIRWYFPGGANALTAGNSGSIIGAYSEVNPLSAFSLNTGTGEDDGGLTITYSGFYNITANMRHSTSGFGNAYLVRYVDAFQDIALARADTAESTTATYDSTTITWAGFLTAGAQLRIIISNIDTSFQVSNSFTIYGIIS